MSIQAVSWVLDESEASSVDRLVLISIANHATGDPWEAFPSVRTIAREARVSTNTVLAAVRRLVDLGELEIVKMGTNRVSTRYRVAPNRASQIRDAASHPGRDARSESLPNAASQPCVSDPRRSVAAASHPGRDRTKEPTSLHPQPDQRDRDTEPGGGTDSIEDLFAGIPLSADERIVIAVGILADRELARRIAAGDRIGNPSGYRHSRLEPLHRQHEAAMRRHLAANPDATVNALADVASPPAPIERAAAMAAEHERNRRRRTGQACPHCDDTGIRLDDTGTAHRCPHLQVVP